MGDLIREGDPGASRQKRESVLTPSALKLLIALQVMVEAQHKLVVRRAIRHAQTRLMGHAGYCATHLRAYVHHLMQSRIGGIFRGKFLKWRACCPYAISRGMQVSESAQNPPAVRRAGREGIHVHQVVPMLERQITALLLDR